MDNLHTILEKCNDLISLYIENTMDRVPNYMTPDRKIDDATFKKIGLDPRVGVIYISKEAIATPIRYRGLLDYYGGFEYVDKADIITIGDYVIYLSSEEDSRVREHIERYYGVVSEEE